VSDGVRSDTVAWDGARRPIPIRTDRFYVTYSYSVDGKVQAGNRVDVFAPLGKLHPRMYQARYPKGKAVDVHVDPTDAAQSVLETPWPLSSLVQAIGGILVGVLLLVFGYHLRVGHRGEPQNVAQKR
jgi:hypothetical protein